MGTSNPRSTDSAMRAPIKLALGIATNCLDRLVHHGVEDYAARLEHEADEPGRAELAADMLRAIAQTARNARRED